MRSQFVDCAVCAGRQALARANNLALHKRVGFDVCACVYVRRRAMSLSRIFLFLTALVLLTACDGGSGGGRGGGGDAEPKGSSNWDEMVWDRENWS